MSVYGLLRRHMSERWAILLFALIYAMLIVCIIGLLPVPPADFRYARY